MNIQVSPGGGKNQLYYFWLKSLQLKKRISSSTFWGFSDRDSQFIPRNLRLLRLKYMCWLSGRATLHETARQGPEQPSFLLALRRTMVPFWRCLRLSSLFSLISRLYLSTNGLLVSGKSYCINTSVDAQYQNELLSKPFERSLLLSRTVLLIPDLEKYQAVASTASKDLLTSISLYSPRYIRSAFLWKWCLSCVSTL